jgi:RND family efflux transporter MFP subunit
MTDVSDVAAPRPGGPPAARRRRILILGAGVLLVLFLAGLWPRVRLWHRLGQRAQAQRNAILAVTTAHPQRADAIAEVPLPGTTEAILETGIYARTDGYLISRSVDIGDVVTSGQLLAEIATPEIDQQLNQAQATLAQAQADVVKLQADLTLARSTLQRYVVAGVGSVSKQQIDERTAAATDAEKAVDAGLATVNANHANVDRLLELQGFQRVYAPFDGVITARNIDQGSLISAGSAQGITELFRLAQVDTLRIFVFVPQAYAVDIQAGQDADVTVRERPDRIFKGIVTRTAGAIDPRSRTLLTEVQVPNRDNALLAGSYVTVHFRIPRTEPPLLIPANALLVDAQGIRVAVVGADGALHYQPIVMGRDYGDRVEVLSGLDPDAVIATGLPGGLADGSRVTVTTPAAAAAPSPVAPPANPATGHAP